MLLSDKWLRLAERRDSDVVHACFLTPAPGINNSDHLEIIWLGCNNIYLLLDLETDLKDSRDVGSQSSSGLAWEEKDNHLSVFRCRSLHWGSRNVTCRGHSQAFLVVEAPSDSRRCALTLCLIPLLHCGCCSRSTELRIVRQSWEFWSFSQLVSQKLSCDQWLDHQSLRVTWQLSLKFARVGVMIKYFSVP